MGAPNNDTILYDLVQKTSDHILELARSQSSSETCIVSMKKQMDSMEHTQNKIIELLQSKMSPDRCAMMHEDVKRQIGKEIADALSSTCKIRHDEIKKEIFTEMKEGAKGWVKNLSIAIKILAYASAAFGGGTLGYSQLQRILGGG